MIAALKKDFLEYYGLTGTNYQVSFYSGSGIIVEHDKKACRECKKAGKQQCSGENEEQTFIIQTGNDINIVDIESFLNQFGGRKAGMGKKCDLMIFNENKIVFADMYCGNRKNLFSHKNNLENEVPGKIAHARKQITETFEKLYNVPALKIIMNSFDAKEGLLAIREKEFSALGNNEASQNIEVFSLVSDLMSRGLYSMLDHNVRFKLVRYPEIYEW
ncbi:MAG: hypothetical protein J5651_06760 [Salinivirgaceae bacterium]|nr:hypothetical protein [Salinivirgaceae bacterium]